MILSRNVEENDRCLVAYSTVDQSSVYSLIVDHNSGLIFMISRWVGITLAKNLVVSKFGRAGAEESKMQKFIQKSLLH